MCELRPTQSHLEQRHERTVQVHIHEHTHGRVHKLTRRVLLNPLVRPTNSTGTLNTWQLWIEALAPSTTAGDPNTYMILTNRDFEQGLPLAGRDFDDAIALLPPFIGPAGQADDDLAKITLKRLPSGLNAGSVRLFVSVANAGGQTGADGDRRGQTGTDGDRRGQAPVPAEHEPVPGRPPAPSWPVATGDSGRRRRDTGAAVCAAVVSDRRAGP
jgi:hypothetical protein